MPTTAHLCWPPAPPLPHLPQQDWAQLCRPVRVRRCLQESRRCPLPAPSTDGGQAAPAPCRLASPCPLPLPSGFARLSPAHRPPRRTCWGWKAPLCQRMTTGAREGPRVAVRFRPSHSQARPPARKGQSEGKSGAACARRANGSHNSGSPSRMGAVCIIYGGLGLRSQAGRPLAHRGTDVGEWKSTPRGSAGSGRPDRAPPPCPLGNQASGAEGEAKR